MVSVRNQCVALILALTAGLLGMAGTAAAQTEQYPGDTEVREPRASEGSLDQQPENSIAAVESSDGSDYAAGELIVTYDSKKAKDKADKKGGKKKAEYSGLLGENVEVLSFDDVKGKGVEGLKLKKAQLEKGSGIKQVELNPIFEEQYTPNDPYFNDGSQWYLKAMDAQAAWDFPHALGNPEPGTNRAVRIGIVDSGYDATHQEMCATFNPDTWFCTTGVKVVAQRDFTDGDNYASDGSSGHGTKVGSVASARTGNQIGLAGASPFAQLVVAKVSYAGDSPCTSVAAGINYAVSKEAKVINVSLGDTETCSVLRTAVSNAYDNGHTIVAAAGNWIRSEATECSPSIKYPAYYPKVIAVGGSAGTSAWTNGCRGPEVDIAAQAEGVMAAVPTYNTSAGKPPYAQPSGTSYAAPQVAGLVANIVSTSDVAPTQAEIRAALYNNADDIAAPGKDDATGYGRPDFYRTLQAAQAY